MTQVNRTHLAGLLLVDELDGTVAISELIEIAQRDASNCNCKTGKCEQWYLASDEVDEACKAVHGENK